MKYIRILFLIALLLELIPCCQAHKMDPIKYFQDAYKSFKLLSYQMGDFLNDENEDYLSFYQDPDRVATGLIGKSETPDFHKVVVFSISPNNAVKKYELPHATSVSYDSHAFEIIQKLQNDDMKWSEYCYIGDFNNNKQDEIILFQLSGLFFSVGIFEYHNGAFVEVLEYPSNTPLSKIEACADGKRKEFVIYDEGRPNTKDGKRNWFRMTWNEKMTNYEVVEKGVQQWYDPKTGKIINE